LLAEGEFASLAQLECFFHGHQSFSIIGLYTTLIFVFSRFLRGTIFAGASSKIMFEDLPYVDRLLQLCLDIYLVRESFEFTLEEDLFAKLIFLYRSPETMIKWTRPKKEKCDDDTDSLSTDTKVSLRKKAGESHFGSLL